MTTMYDSTTPSEIPADAAIVAGYIDGHFKWTDSDWALFPNAIKVRIAVFPSTNDGRVLDVERGDATPQQAPGWVAMRRTSAVNPLSGPACVYCSDSAWDDVKAAFARSGIRPPDYWIAHYDGVPVVPSGAVAKQYQSLSSPNYDISVTVPGWPIALPEVSNMAVVTTNPNNNGKLVLDPANGTWYGFSTPDVYLYYVNVMKVPEVAAPSAAVFAKFTQAGTI